MKCNNRLRLNRMVTRALMAVPYVLAALAALINGGAPQAFAVVVTDNFSDMNDTANPIWTHLDGAAGSTGQTWDASGGQYHLQAPGNSGAGASAGFGFVGSYVQPSFTNVRVTADVVAFPNVGPTGSYFGVAARLNGDNSQPVVTPTKTFTALHGYIYQYEALANGGLGELVLSILHGGGTKDVGSFAGASQVEPLLNNAKDYRFLLEVVGDVLHGQVVEIDAGGAVVALIADQWRDLAAFPAGLGNYDGDAATPNTEFVPYTSGYSGLSAVGHAFYSDGDVTFDNFSTSIPGDFDEDGDVDGDDLGMWRTAFGQTNVGDADADGDSDGNDLLIWQRTLTGGAPAGAAVATVPEPGTACLVASALLTLASYRRGCRIGHSHT